MGMFKKWKFFLSVLIGITGIEYNFLKINLKRETLIIFLYVLLIKQILKEFCKNT